jgi:hypothetical protein
MPGLTGIFVIKCHEISRFNQCIGVSDTSIIFAVSGCECGRKSTAKCRVIPGQWYISFHMNVFFPHSSQSKIVRLRGYLCLLSYVRVGFLRLNVRLGSVHHYMIRNLDLALLYLFSSVSVEIALWSHVFLGLDGFPCWKSFFLQESVLRNTLLSVNVDQCECVFGISWLSAFYRPCSVLR